MQVLRLIRAILEIKLFLKIDNMYDKLIIELTIGKKDKINLHNRFFYINRYLSKYSIYKYKMCKL